LVWIPEPEHGITVKQLIRLFFILIFLSIQGKSLLAAPVVLEQGREKYDLSSDLMILEDKTGKVEVDQLVSGQFDIYFEDVANYHPPYINITNSVIWAKVELKKGYKGDSDWELVFEGNIMDSVSVYFVPEGSDSVVSALHSGGKVRPSERPYNSLRPIFPVDLGEKGGTIYIRIKSDDTAVFLFPFLMTKKSLYNDARGTFGWYGIYFGIIISMFFYNLFVYFTVREKSYLYYVFYILFAAFSISAMKGYVDLYLYNAANPWYGFTMQVIAAVAIGLAVQFTREFLQLKTHLSKLDRFLQYFLVALFASLILYFISLTASNIVLHLFLIGGSVSLLVAGFLLFNKLPFARYFSFAWGIYLTMMILFAVQILGFSMPFHFLYFPELGNSIEVILLSFALASRIRVLQNQAERDYLTGLYNRRSIQGFFDRFVEESEKKGGAAGNIVTLILFDIDFFKDINDTHGHAAGDHVLKQVAHLVSGSLRAEDYFGRWGGEEFAILFKSENAEAGRITAEKIRGLIEKGFAGKEIPVTASFGVASYRPGESRREFFHSVDEQMYRAKRKGRNCVCFLDTGVENPDSGVLA